MDSEPSSTWQSPIVLSGPWTWNDWIWLIQTKAEYMKHWKYMDPSISTRPAPPEDPRQLSTEDWKLRKVKAFADKRYHRNEDEMLDIIAGSIDKAYLPYIRGPTIKTNWDRLRALKAQVEPSKRDRELYVRNRYRALLKVQRHMDVDTWLSKWQAVYMEGQQLKLPEVAGDRAQYDFLISLKSINEAWAISKLVRFIESPDDEKPSLGDLIASFRQFRSYHEGRTQRRKHSRVKLATFQGKQGTPPLCVCGENHRYRECCYLNEAIRPKDWNPDRDVIAKIKEIQRTKPRLKRHIERTINSAKARLSQGRTMAEFA